MRYPAFRPALLRRTTALFCLAISVLNNSPSAAQLTANIPGRPDNLSQAQVDMLLGNGEMNFDGFRFDNKRMDYINFAKGSFRGTTFYNTVLDFGVARRTAPEPDRFDFEEANIYLSKLKNTYFAYWKFTRAVFQADSIVDAVLSRCSFTDTKFYNTKFIRTRFNNGLGQVLNGTQFFSCTFEGGRFDSLKLTGGAINVDTRFRGTVFNEAEIANTLISKVGNFAPVFEACSFINTKFSSVTLTGVTFDLPALKTAFQNVAFNNVNWTGGTVHAAFMEPCIFTGPSSRLQNIDFASSVFNNTVFGAVNATYKLPIRQCNFTACTFNGATFYHCNLENSVFPPVADLQAAGVRFYNCLNAPYNSQ